MDFKMELYISRIHFKSVTLSIVELLWIILNTHTVWPLNATKIA